MPLAKLDEPLPNSFLMSVPLPIATGTPGQRGYRTERRERWRWKRPIICESEPTSSATAALRAVLGYHALVPGDVHPGCVGYVYEKIIVIPKAIKPIHEDSGLKQHF